MARHFNGSTDYGVATGYTFSGAGGIPAVGVVSLAAWVWVDSPAINGVVFEYGGVTGDQGFDVIHGFSTSPLEALIRSYTPTNGWEDSYVVPSLGAWHHMAWAIGNTLNQVWIDGVPATTTPVLHGAFPTHFDDGLPLTFGARLSGAGRNVTSLFLGARFAEFGLWAGRFTNQQVVALANRSCPPFTDAVGSDSYWPLLGYPSPEPSWVARHPMTLAGTTYLNHPGVQSMVGFQ